MSTIHCGKVTGFDAGGREKCAKPLRNRRRNSDLIKRRIKLKADTVRVFVAATERESQSEQNV